MRVLCAIVFAIAGFTVGGPFGAILMAIMGYCFAIKFFG